MIYKILCKQINNLSYSFNGKSGTKFLFNFKDPLAFYKKIRNGYMTQNKAEEKQKQFKSAIDEIVKERHKSEEQKYKY